MTTPVPSYSKMTPLWAKDRVKGDHAEIAKERRARYAASTTIDEIDNSVSQNEVSLENFEVEDDQKSLEINVVHSPVLSQDAMSFKSKKRRLAEDDELGSVISQSFDIVSMEIRVYMLINCQAFVSRGGSCLSHLFFADDSLIFCKVTIEECDILQRILSTYEKAFGQQLNQSKTSLFFSLNTVKEIQDEIRILFGAHVIRQHVKYLGLPSLVGRNKRNTFMEVKAKLAKKLASWKEKLLSKLVKKS